MKREEFSNEITQAQLQEFAERLRKSTATEMSICLVSGIVGEDRSVATACALAFAGKRYTDMGKSQLDAAVVMLKTAATIINKNTGGATKLFMRSPAGEFQIGEGLIDKWVDETLNV